jgi:6-phosphogluconolactonase
MAKWRWSLLACVGLLTVVGSLCALGRANEKADDKDKFWVFVGTYTGPKPGANGQSGGIYRFEFDAATGKLTNGAVAAETRDPSFLAIHPSKRWLYSAGEGPGEVSAFALDARTGKLTFINGQTTGGGAPCHLSVDSKGKNVLAANYNGGSVCCLPIQEDGSLGKASAFIQHTGKSVDPKRQTHPYAHSINLDAANRFAFVADLGLDKVLVYRFDSVAGTLKPNDPPAVDVAKGAGPRHFAFHPSGKFAYVINELNSTVTAMRYDADKGLLTPLQSLSTLPGPHPGNSTAEVVVHPSGKFLYGSNRGHNSIAVFAINPDTGELKVVGHQGKDIKTPRNFALDPSGTWAIVANQDSDSMVVFKVDAKTGELLPTDVRAAVKRPVCVRFVEVAN